MLSPLRPRHDSTPASLTACLSSPFPPPSSARHSTPPYPTPQHPWLVFLDPWQAWSDPSAAPLRRDMAHRVLGICRTQGRGGLAVQLVEIGARLASRGDVLWPGAPSYWAAMEAVSRRIVGPVDLVVCSVCCVWSFGFVCFGSGFCKACLVCLRGIGGGGAYVFCCLWFCLLLVVVAVAVVVVVMWCFYACFAAWSLARLFDAARRSPPPASRQGLLRARQLTALTVTW